MNENEIERREWLLVGLESSNDTGPLTSATIVIVFCS